MQKPKKNRIVSSLVDQYYEELTSCLDDALDDQQDYESDAEYGDYDLPYGREDAQVDSVRIALQHDPLGILLTESEKSLAIEFELL